jgi:hypothetical protein
LRRRIQALRQALTADAVDCQFEPSAISGLSIDRIDAAGAKRLQEVVAADRFNESLRDNRMRSMQITAQVGMARLADSEQDDIAVPPTAERLT